MTSAIQFVGVSKDFPKNSRSLDRTTYILQAVAQGRPPALAHSNAVRALDDVSFNIKSGERVGLIGRNGSGKSTILKLIAGSQQPSTGTVSVRGQVYALLPGTVSFSEDLSVRSNAHQYLGYHLNNTKEIEKRVLEIATFTELGPYFDQPVRNLSLGMRMRAEFSVATAVDAEIILIDEVLGAGDIYWTERIRTRLQGLCSRGSTIVLVSHSLDQIMRFSSRAIWIDGGKVVRDGPVDAVAAQYETFLHRLGERVSDIEDKTVSATDLLATMEDATLPSSGQSVNRWPARQELFISGVWLNGTTAKSATLGSGDVIRMKCRFDAKQAGTFTPRLLVTFWRIDGKRMAVAECAMPEQALVAEQSLELNMKIEGEELRPDLYHVSLTLMDDSHPSHSNLQDVLFKSFSILTNGSTDAQFRKRL